MLLFPQWNQDCLEFLLKIIYQLGVESSQIDLCKDSNPFEGYEMPKKKSKRSKKGNQDKLLIPAFNKVSSKNNISRIRNDLEHPVLRKIVTLRRAV